MPHGVHKEKDANIIGFLGIERRKMDIFERANKRVQSLIEDRGFVSEREAFNIIHEEMGDSIRWGENGVIIDTRPFNDEEEE